ncbi:MAG: hypothetical protein KAV01_06835 [Candidatus Lokiarchaeota archaeon]|nr:hypothetical protein [Candidatus Lokiarchaeota archaeon]
MVYTKRYKWPLITLIVIIAALMFVIAVGFTIGFLSEDPDGLERVLINNNGEEWLENLYSPWIPLLSWITNDYIAGIIGVILAIAIMIAVFYLIIFLKKRNTE